ncbi:hypothetical protein BJV77DRAFT_1072222 [Russula vinacea]|nr:hypothetical protein BJV77DRAFT_1072222 [Russula vinacea]
MPRSWSKPYTKVLKSRTDDWIKSKGRVEKKVIIQEIIDKIEGTFGEDEEGPENLDDKIWNWFGNNVSKKKSPEGAVPKKGNKKPFSIRDVIKHRTGAQIFLMAAYEKPEGTIALSKFQTKPRQGDPFTEVMPMWKLCTWDSWSKYAQAHFNHDGDESDTSTNERSILKPHKIVSFESHPTLGWPLLPKMGDMTSQECKDTMRAFVTATYCHFTCDSHAKVPWKDLSLDEQHDLISSDSFSEDMHLLDPFKLQCSDIEALWKHWTRRQKANSRPLIFYPSAALNIRHAKAHPDDDDDDDDDDEDKADNKKSETPHPHSPAAHASSPSSKIDFLSTLSSDLVYTEFVDHLSSREVQEDGLPAQNLPNWGNWQLSSMYLPGEFHQVGALLPLFQLAHEEWSKMGTDAELVVLSMGLAFQDITAAHFNEELPEDAPSWLTGSPLEIDSAHRLSEIWGQQL